jgi:hypothetical protein
MSGMGYEEKDAADQRSRAFLQRRAGRHDPRGETFGFSQPLGFVGAHPGGAKIIGFLLDELDRFVGNGWRQEEDIALQTLHRSEAS